MKKALALLLAVVVMILSLPSVPAQALSKVSLSKLMEMFPDGKYWNHMGMYENNPDGWTDIPCDHVLVDSGLGYDYYVGLGSCNSFGDDVQCVGFVNRLVYEAYGVDTYKNWKQTDLDHVKPGDVIRFKYDMHSVLVTSADKDTITYGECNGDFSDCQIRWNVQATREEIAESLTTVFSAPAALSIPLANHSYLSDETLRVGGTVTVECFGQGGDERYTYEVAVKLPDAKDYTVLLPYGKESHLEYTPEKPGQYQVKVSVKDTAKQVADKELSFTVQKKLPIVNFSGLDSGLQDTLQFAEQKLLSEHIRKYLIR